MCPRGSGRMVKIHFRSDPKMTDGVQIEMLTSAALISQRAQRPPPNVYQRLVPMLNLKGKSDISY